MKNKKSGRKRIGILSLLLLCAAFFLCKTVSYAYTEEEKEAAKAWLSANGYSPDASGAAQAYQDYLDGKFDSIPEQEDIEPDSSTIAPKANEAEAGKDKGKEDSGKDNLEDKNKEKPDKDLIKTNEQNAGWDSDAENSRQETTQGQDVKEPTGEKQEIGTETIPIQEQPQAQDLEEMLKQLAESMEAMQEQNDYENNPATSKSGISGNETQEDKDIQTVEGEFHPQKINRNAFIVWALFFVSVLSIMGIVYLVGNRYK